MKNQIIEYLELTIEQVEKDIELEKTEYRIGKLYAYKESLAVVKKLSIHSVVSSSNMRKALETVVRGYEGDGMENMQIRDEVFYKTCKEALTFDDSTKD